MSAFRANVYEVIPLPEPLQCVYFHVLAALVALFQVHKYHTPKEVILLPDLFLAIANRRQRVIESRILSRLGLTYPRFQVLEGLLLSGHSHMGKLADVIECTRGNLTRLCDELVAAGLLYRQEDPVDRRAHFISLTERGMAVAQEALSLIDAHPALKLPPAVKQYLLDQYAGAAK